MLPARKLLTVLAAVLLTTSPAFAENIDFESLSNGELGPFNFVTPTAGVTITPDGPPPGDHIGVAIQGSLAIGRQGIGAPFDPLKPAIVIAAKNAQGFISSPQFS